MSSQFRASASEGHHNRQHGMTDSDEDGEEEEEEEANEQKVMVRMTPTVTTTGMMAAMLPY